MPDTHFLRFQFPVLEEMLKKQRKLAAESPRRRSMHLICGGPTQPVQAFLNTFMKDSYAQPHKHKVDEACEGVAGTFSVFIFDNNGSIQKHVVLQAGDMFCIPANCWHTIVCMTEQGTIFETKQGFYSAVGDKVFAPWAPAEGDQTTADYLESLRSR